MPRKKKTTTEIIEDLDQVAAEANQAAEAIPIEAEPERTQVEDDVINFLSAFAGQPVIVKIHRHTAGGKLEYVSEGDLDTVNEKMIQDSFGGGRYRLMIYSTEKPGIIANRTLHISGVSKINQPPPPPDLKTDPTLTLLQMQIENMNQQNRQNQEMMLKMIEQFGHVAGGRPESASLPELIESMGTLKTFLTPPPSSSPLDLLSGILPLATKLIDLGAGRPASESSGGFGDTLKDIIKEVPNLMRGFAMAKSQAPAPVVSGPAQIPPPPGQRQALDPADPAVAPVLGYIGFLKTRCLQGQDVSLWIDTVLATLDTEQSDLVIKLLDRPYEEIAIIDPDLLDIKYRSWFENFFGGLKDALLGDGIAAGESGNSLDASGNGEPDAASLSEKPGS